MKSLEFKYMNFKKAYERLSEVCKAYDGTDDIIRDSMIQRFEFTYELCHRTLQEFMKFMGITLENSFPRTIFKKAYKHDIISNDELWIRLMEDRNRTSHIYNENVADIIAQSIVNEYIVAIGELVNNIGKSIKAD